MADILTVRSDALPQDAHPVSLKASEALSRIYKIELGLMIRDPAFDGEQAVSRRAVVRINTAKGTPPFGFCGVMASVEHLHEFADHALYRAVLVPRLWQLSLSHHSRVFVNDSVVDIIEAVLKSNGFTTKDYELRLQSNYGKMEHVCQYQESDLAFIGRWLERDGLYYYFEHGDKQEKLVITDHQSYHESLSSKPVRHVTLADDNALVGDALHSFQCRFSSLPATVQLQDYDYGNPDLDVAGAAAVHDQGTGAVNVYGENFTTQQEGKRLAQVRAEQYLSERQVYRGEGRIFLLRSGYRFRLEEHPRDSFNKDYLATEAEHYVNQSASHERVKRYLDVPYEEEYRVSVTAIPAATQFRPTRITKQPRIYGMENAVVDGEKDSPYAQMDAHGRYLVKINFDESDLADGKASTRVRMLQPHGGDNEGFHFPLRKGTEVMLTFQGGDPDRPVISGVLPNAHKTSPVSKDNSSMNVIQTGGLNRIELEDKDGAQHVRISSPSENSFLHMGAPNPPYNVRQETDGDMKVKTGRTHDLESVGPATQAYHASQRITVGGARHVTAHKGEFITVLHHRNVTIDQGADYHTDVLGGDCTTRLLGGDRKTELEGGNYTVKGTTGGENLTLELAGGKVINISPIGIALSDGLGAGICLMGGSVAIWGNTVTVLGKPIMLNP